MFLLSVSAGCLTGLFYDIYKSLTAFFRIKKIALSISDIIFWIVITITTFVLLILVGNGEMRGFMLVGLGIGLYIQLRLLGNYTARVTMRLLILMRKNYIYLVKLFSCLLLTLIAPFKFMYFFMTWPFKMIILVANRIYALIRPFLSGLIPNVVKINYKKITEKIKNFISRLQNQ